jgi:glycerol-3-phosphate dehydrogenase
MKPKKKLKRPFWIRKMREHLLESYGTRSQELINQCPGNLDLTLPRGWDVDYISILRTCPYDSAIETPCAACVKRQRLVYIYEKHLKSIERRYHQSFKEHQ